MMQLTELSSRYHMIPFDTVQSKMGGQFEVRADGVGRAMPDDFYVKERWRPQARAMGEFWRARGYRSFTTPRKAAHAFSKFLVSRLHCSGFLQKEGNPNRWWFIGWKSEEGK